MAEENSQEVKSPVKPTPANIDVFKLVSTRVEAVVVGAQAFSLLADHFLTDISELDQFVGLLKQLEPYKNVESKVFNNRNNIKSLFATSNDMNRLAQQAKSLRLQFTDIRDDLQEKKSQSQSA